MSNIAHQRIQREFREVVKSEDPASKMSILLPVYQREFAPFAEQDDLVSDPRIIFDLHLYQCAHEVERYECRLLSPASHFIRLAGDKTASSEALRIKGVRVPRGQLLEMDSPLPADFNYPAILKPNDGTGSLFLQITDSHNAKQPAGISMRLEEQIRGMPCSASFLCCGDQEPIPLPPMEQLFSDDDAFRYHGGRRILDGQLVTRATRLGRSALNALPLTLGYVGIDIVLGDRLNGSEDHVIEVNPRLTTSYIGLCRIATTNLAEAMLEIAFGHVPSVEFSDKSVEFLADGTIL